MSKNNSKKVRIIEPENLDLVWSKVLEGEEIENTIFLILDFDGTLNETDEKLLSCVKAHNKRVREGKANEVKLIVNSGRSAYERMNSTKFGGAECLAQYADIMISQGGSVVRTVEAKSEEWIIIPIQKNIYKIIDVLAEALEIDRGEVFRGEHLCLHYFDVNEKKEVISIPIALEDELEIRRRLARYDGNIMEAYYDGAIPECYTLAIEEYLERGMPPEEIGVAYYSELGSLIITELTIVGEHEAMKRAKVEFEEKLGITLRIQQEIADRKAGTRMAPEGVHPDISDVIAVGKKQHIDAIMRHHKLLIGFGDQGNDDFLFSTPISVVANAAQVGVKGGWDFSILMADLAVQWENNKDQHCVIHAEKFGDGREINWLLEAIIEKDTTEERITLCHQLAESDRNLAMREWLLKGARPGTTPVILG